jgi:hypothetical protein
VYYRATGTCSLTAHVSPDADYTAANGTAQKFSVLMPRIRVTVGSHAISIIKVQLICSGAKCSGTVKLRLTCSGAKCSGTIEYVPWVRVTQHIIRYVLARGQAKNIIVTLSSYGKKLLEEPGRPRLAVVMRVWVNGGRMVAQRLEFIKAMIRR